MFEEGADEDKMIEVLKNRYSPEDRSLMLKEHLKEIYSRENIYDTESDLDRSLQRAFVVVRGEDLRDKIQKVQPLSNEGIAKIKEDHDKRYENGHDDDDDDMPTAKEVYTNVREYEQPSYTNVIDLPGGKIRFKELFKRPPDQADPTTLVIDTDSSKARDRVYDNEVKPLQEDGKEIEGTNPLKHSHITWMQLEYLAEETDFDLSKFKPLEFQDEEIVNQETIRTMLLFMNEGDMTTFVKEEKGYIAALGAPVHNGKWYLLAEFLPKFDVAEVTVHMGDTAAEEGINFTNYKIVDKQKEDSRVSEYSEEDVKAESSESASLRTD